jgi:hypothetical protein
MALDPEYHVGCTERLAREGRSTGRASVEGLNSEASTSRQGLDRQGSHPHTHLVEGIQAE